MRFAGIQLSNYLDPMNFDGISTASMEGRAKERMYDSQADYLVDKAGIDAESLIKQAKYGASATRAQGSAAGSSAMFGGLASGVGGLAGGFANMGGAGGGGGADKYGFDPIGSQGNPLGGMGGRPLLNY
jgi:hypothetical protein